MTQFLSTETRLMALVCLAVWGALVAGFRVVGDVCFNALPGAGVS